MVSRTIQDQQPENLSPTTANSAVQEQELEIFITNVATCYQDPEPELDMAELELEPAWNSLIFLVRRES